LLRRGARLRDDFARAPEDVPVRLVLFLVGMFVFAFYSSYVLTYMNLLLLSSDVNALLTYPLLTKNNGKGDEKFSTGSSLTQCVG
jgi:hypothetical protein